MKQALIYSLKVWLTSCIVVPFVWGIGFVILHGGREAMMLPLSVLFLILATILFSSLTWLMFFVVVSALLKYSTTRFRPKAVVSGELLVALTFGVFMYAYPGFDRPVYSLLMLFHGIAVGLGTWFYKLRPSTSTTTT